MSEVEDPRAAKGSPRYRRALVALFCAGIAVYAQIYSPQALLPAIAAEFRLSESTSSLAIGATTLGLALGMLPWGRLSDRIGRVSAMRWAIVMTVLTGLIMPFMPSFETLIGIRLLLGVVIAGVPSIAVIALSETVAPLALGGAVGAFVAGNTIGGLSGRLLSTPFGEMFGWRWGLFSVSAVAAIAALLFLLLMPPTAVPASGGLPIWRAIRANLRNPGVMVMVLQAFLLMGGFVAAYNYLAFRLEQAPFLLSPTQISWLFLAYVAGALSSERAWSLTKRIPPVGVLLSGIGVMVIGLALTLLPSLIWVIAGLVIFTIGFFCAHSIALSLVSLRADPGGRSLSPSLYNLAYYGGSTLFGWAGGIAFAIAGWGGIAAMIGALAAGAAVAAWWQASRRGGMREADSL